MLRRYAYTINGNKIYYCNRNGVYKCDTDSSDSTSSVISLFQFDFYRK